MKKIYNFFRAFFNFKKNKLEDVFTPSKSAMLTFVERPELRKQIEKALIQHGQQIILYGHSGSGKTTIIQNILKEKNKNVITTNCTSEMTYNHLLSNAFDQLNAFYTSSFEEKDSKKISGKNKTTSLVIESEIGGEIGEEHTEKIERIIAPQLSPQKLTELLGANETIWVVEDFHKVNEEERRKFSEMLKVFVDASNSYNVKVIAIGAVRSAREVIDYNKELNTRVSQVHIPLLSPIELESIISKGEELLNVKFDMDLKNGIISYCLSLGAICHNLSFSICYNNNVFETQKKIKSFNIDSLGDAIKEYVNCNADSYKKELDRILKTDNGNHYENILKAMSLLNKEEELKLEEILKIVNSISKNKTVNNIKIKECLNNLTTTTYDEIIRYDDNSGKYSFADPFLKAYIKMYFDKNKELKEVGFNKELIKSILEDMIKSAQSRRKATVGKRR